MIPDSQSCFESFVVSERSQTAFLAAVTVGESPGDAHNPLLLSGPSGSGKSHLLRAIANSMHSHRPEASIVRTTGHAMATDLAEAIRLHQVEAFQSSLTRVDALLVDDLELRPKRDRTFRAIVEVLAKVVEAGAQVVVASGMDARYGRMFERRIQSRFGRVLAAELGYPSMAGRMEIARRAATLRGVHLPPGALRFIARRSTGNPRELQGMIARIAAETAIAQRSLGLAEVRQAVSRVL